MTLKDDKNPPLFGWEWNQSEEFPDELRNVLATITCLNPGSFQSTQIGSGFVIQSRGARALILTAAHVITEGVRAFQNTARGRAHRTIPPDFLPPEEVSAATRALRAIVQNGDRVHLCRVAAVMWDQPADLAILAVTTQPDEAADLFQWHLKFAATDPNVGDLIAIAGFTDFTTQSEAEPHWKGLVSRRPILRIGKVTDLHPDGTFLVRSPCIEATMPTFSGMSGGPAFLYSPGSEMRVFGLLSASSGGSSDPTAPDPDAHDRSKANRPSTFSIIPRTIEGPFADGAQLASLKFTISGKALNDEIDPTLFQHDWSWQPV